MTANIAWVEVVTKDGTVYKGGKARVPWDHLAGEKAPGDKEIIDKFMWLGGEAGVTKEKLRRVVDLSMHLENIPDASVEPIVSSLFLIC